MKEDSVKLTEGMSGRVRGWERLAVLLVLALPACTTPMPYDCAAPPSSRVT